jgi:hypothetical protein
MELPDALPDAPDPAAPFPLPAPRRADAIPRAPHASDASAGVLPDEAADAPIPVLAAVPYAEKLVVPAPDALAPTVETHPPQLLPVEAKAPCIPGAGRSAA